MKLTNKIAVLFGVTLLTITGTAQALLISPTNFTSLGGWQTEATNLGYVTTAAPSITGGTIPDGGTFTLDLATLFPGINILGFSFEMSLLATNGNRTTTVTTASTPASGASWSAFTNTTGYVAVLSESNELFTSISFTKNKSSSDDFTISNFTYATAPVPLPAAVWLMGSALLGLVSIGRRKKPS